VDLLFYFTLLLIKHTVVDLALQHYIVGQKKLQWLNPKAHWHYAQHGIGTMLVTFPLTGDLLLSALVSLLDYLIHWHVDWAKHHWIHRYGWTSADAGFWWAAAIDQTLHYLTYCAIVMLVASHVFYALY
jgi:hypothetical protein